MRKEKTLCSSPPFIQLGGTAMVYEVRNDLEPDVLTVMVAEKGKLSFAEEVGDIIIHFDDNGKPLFMEILKASKIIPLMVQSLAKKEITMT